MGSSNNWAAHLRFQQRRPERFPVHLHANFDFHLLYLTLSPPHRILRVRPEHRSISPSMVNSDSFRSRTSVGNL